MSYAIDLNERQSTRTLEQAIRHQASVILEPRIWTDGATIECHLLNSEGMIPTGRRAYAAPLIVVAGGDPAPLAETQPPAIRSFDREAMSRFHTLIGTYCDAIVQLGQNRYLFSSDVVGVEPGGKTEGGIEIHLSRPTVIQVAQRRRFRRIQLPQSSQIEIRWRNDDGVATGGIGWLYNIGQDGIACRTDTLLSDRLWIGQELTLEFSLRPGEPEHYLLDATLCSKTPAGSADRTILGLQFQVGPGHEPSAAVLEALRRRLRALASTPAGTRKGVDA